MPTSCIVKAQGPLAWECVWDSVAKFWLPSLAALRDQGGFLLLPFSLLLPFLFGEELEHVQECLKRNLQLTWCTVKLANCGLPARSSEKCPMCGLLFLVRVAQYDSLTCEMKEFTMLVMFWGWEETRFLRRRSPGFHFQQCWGQGWFSMLCAVGIMMSHQFFWMSDGVRSKSRWSGGSSRNGIHWLKDLYIRGSTTKGRKRTNAGCRQWVI